MNKARNILLLILLVSAMCLISSCGSGDSGDSTIVAPGTEAIAGEYKIVVGADQEESTRDNWVLSIYKDEEIGDWYLNIYDDKTNTGIYGPIAEIAKSSITVWHGPDYYTEMPSPSWETDGDKFNLEYKATDDEIELTNSGATLKFKRI